MFRYKKQNDKYKNKNYSFFKKKVCHFCVNKLNDVDYKDVGLLSKFITERCKILPGRASGTCAKHQRVLTKVIKKARMMALLPFSASKRELSR
ncbi:MAG: 30S ribosomal protein S18 [Deltaproteobacteria bacterium]|nr:30S ribosomal protein S18 [Deltaproteobacteria bacterium]